MNEYSLRYSEARPDFYIPRPNEWRKQASKNVQASDGYFESNAGDYFEGRTSTICNLAYEAYQEMINHGVAREQARIVLPLNLYTTMTVCWDLKNLIHFIALRDGAHAQLEIQVYGKAMKSLISQVVPWVVELYEEKI